MALCLLFVFLQVASKCESFTIQGYTGVIVQAEWLTENTDMRTATYNVPPSNQPAALLGALPLLKTLHTPATPLHFEEFTMTHELPAAVAAAAELGWGEVSMYVMDWPTDHTGADHNGGEHNSVFTSRLPPLQFLKLRQPIRDRVSRDMLACVSSMGELRASALFLHDPLPEGTKVPWGKVVMYRDNNIGDWAQAAHVLRDTSCVWDIEEVTIYLEPDMVCTRTHTCANTNTHTHTHTCMHALTHTGISHDT